MEEQLKQSPIMPANTTAPTPPAEPVIDETIQFEDFAKVKLKVGQILTAE